jgi:hypothetical protein
MSYQDVVVSIIALVVASCIGLYVSVISTRETFRIARGKGRVHVIYWVAPLAFVVGFFFSLGFVGPNIIGGIAAGVAIAGMGTRIVVNKIGPSQNKYQILSDERIKERVEKGKHWVEDLLQRLAQECNTSISELRWEDRYPDFYRLYFGMRGKNGRIEFITTQLEDCPDPDNKDTQIRLESHIRSYLSDLTRLD